MFIIIYYQYVSAVFELFVDICKSNCREIFLVNTEPQVHVFIGLLSFVTTPKYDY